MKQCTNCSNELENEAKFCTNCGQSQESLKCPSCMGDISSEQKFCLSCGNSLKKEVKSNNNSVASLFRQPELLAQEISIGSINNNNLESNRIPSDTIGAVMRDGKVVSVLNQGDKFSRSWADRFFGMLGKESKSQFYLIDLRPIIFSIPSVEKVITGEKRNIMSSAELLLNLNNMVELAAFLHAVTSLGGKIQSEDLVKEFTGHIIAAIQQTDVSDSVEWDSTISTQVSEMVSKKTGSKYGLEVKVSVRLGKTKYFETLELGQDTESTMITCDNCYSSLNALQKFCTSCGSKVDSVATEQKAIITKDGKVIKVCTYLSYEAQEQILSAAYSIELEGIITDVMTKFNFDDFLDESTRAGLENEIELKLREILKKENANIIIFSIIDIKNAAEKWLLGAQAELEQAKQESLVGREWLLQEESDLDIQALAQDIAVKRQRTDLQFKLNQDMTELEDRKARQALKDEDSELEIQETRRDVNQQVEIDSINREAQRKESRENREDFDEQLSYDMENEFKVVDHDTKLARQGMEFESEKIRQQTDDSDYVQNSEIEQARKKQDLDIEKEEKLQALKIDKLRAMADLDSQMAAQESEDKKQEQIHAQKMRESLKGLSAAEILAAQAAELGNTNDGAGVAEGIASAIQSTQVNDMQKELYERMLEEKNKDADRQQNIVNSSIEMQQQANKATNEAYKDAANQAKSMSEKSMGAMSSVASSSAKSSGTSATRTNQSKAKRTCPECNNSLPAKAVFCGECGYEMTKDD